MRRFAWRIVLVLTLGAVNTFTFAMIPAFFNVSSGNAPQTCRLFPRHNRPWFNTEIHGLLLRQNAWVQMPLASDSSVDEVLSQAWTQLEPRVTSIANRRMSGSPPAWGTLASDHPPPTAAGTDHGFGWPATCVWFRDLVHPDGSTSMEGCRSLFGFPPQRTPEDPAIPTWVLYRGFAINIGFFSILWTALLFGPGTVRRELRLRRGHCLACGYDVKGEYGSTCPECGPLPAPP